MNSSSIADKIRSMQSEAPMVSIVISAYNEERYLPSTILGLSRIKTQYPLEILLVDNKSNDKTGEIARKYGLRVILEEKKGSSYARQAGLEHAKGDYIFCTDADTIIPTTWIDTGLEYFFQNPQLGLLAGGIKYRGASIFFYVAQFMLNLWNKLLRKKQVNRVYGANMIYRKTAAKNVGGYTPGINLGEDIELMRKIQKEYEVFILDNRAIRVTTSGRRFKSFFKVMHYIASRWKNEKNMYNQKIITGEDFTDIR